MLVSGVRAVVAQGSWWEEDCAQALQTPVGAELIKKCGQSEDCEAETMQSLESRTKIVTYR